jgi:protease PrsW
MVSLWLTISLVVVLYLGVARLIDMNEKEPLWSMLLFFLLGSAAAVVVSKGLPASVALQPLPRAVASQLGVFLAMSAGMAGLAVHAHLRGWSEFDGMLDGVVYGITVGLGFGAARQLISGLSLASVELPGFETAPLADFGTVALSGLADGICGAVVGAGFGIASQLRSPALRSLVPLAALVAAVLVQYGHTELGQGDAFGSLGLLRARIALGLPALLIAATAVYALRSEASAIRRQLGDESQSGCVSERDYALLRSYFKREGLYWRTLLRFDLGTWSALKELHKQQVQLAFAKDRLAGESTAAGRTRVEGEISQIRVSILATQRKLSGQGAA